MTPGSEIVAPVELVIQGTWPQRTRRVFQRFRVKRIKGDEITAIGHFSGAPQRWCFFMQDRGVTWAPAWRESERRAFEVACALQVAP